ncbi:MAG: hypothetical protein WDZ46_07045 [Solirubrobacterales bacterium]
MAAQVLVVADDVAPLHQPHARGRVHLLDRGPDQVAPVGLAAGADLDLGGDLVRVAGRILQLEQDGRALAYRQRRVEHEADAGGAGVDELSADVPVGREAVGRRRALEAVDLAPLAAAADGAQGAQHAAQLDQAEQRHDHGGDPGQVGQRTDPGEVEQAHRRAAGQHDRGRDHQVQLAHRRQAAAVGALLRGHLEGRPAGADDAAQGARVDLHRQQLVVGGLADLHVAAGQGRAGEQVEADRRQPERRQGNHADLHRQRPGPQHQAEREQQQQPHRRRQVGGEADEVGEALQRPQGLGAQGGLGQREDGEVAARPAVALQQVAVEVVRGEALDEDLVVVAAGPAVALHADRRVEVLGDRLGRDAADLEQGTAPQHGRRAAPVGGSVAILAGADDAVEERLLVAPDDVVLDRVVVEEVVRALHQGDFLVVEVADQGVERVGHRHVVGVEHQDQLAVGAGQGGVDVARLGVRVVGPGQVAGAGQLSQLGHLRPAAVVEQVGRVRIGQGAAAGQGRRDDLEGLVVGADVDVDLVARRGGRPHRRRARPRVPGQRAERPEAVDLGDQQHREEDRVGAFAAPAETPDQVADAPEESAEREQPQRHGVAVEIPADASLRARLHASPSTAARVGLSPGMPCADPQNQGGSLNDP